MTSASLVTGTQTSSQYNITSRLVAGLEDFATVCQSKNDCQWQK